MPKALKTQSEFAELMMREARSSRKCADLHSVAILGPLARSNTNWDFATAPTGRSPECQNELQAIAGRLQREFDPSGD
jgi:hypothetical protein